MWKGLGLGLAAAMVLLVVVIALQPAEFTISRNRDIAAPPATLFSMTNDLHQWNRWSPWAKLDPAMKITYSGAALGKGAVYEWTGNSEVGSGRMEIIESTPNSKVGIALQFRAPFESTNGVEFAFMPKGPLTNVRWTMNGTNDFLGKAFALFMDMDAMVGADFEKGLAELKKLAEPTN